MRFISIVNTKIEDDLDDEGGDIIMVSSRPLLPSVYVVPPPQIQMGKAVYRNKTISNIARPRHADRRSN